MSSSTSIASIYKTAHGLEVGQIVTITFSGDGAHKSGTYTIVNKQNDHFEVTITDTHIQTTLACTYYLGTSKHKLYNLVDHTFVFSGEILLDITYLVQFTDLPPVFQRYVTSRAASRAAAQLVSNPELVKLLQNQEALTRASVMEYETQQGDHSYMGWGHNTSYSSYQPYKALRR